MRGLRGPREHLSSCSSLPDEYSYGTPYTQNGNIEIHGDATLCFDESGKTFQGVIDTKDGSHYSVYGSKSQQTNRNFRRTKNSTRTDSSKDTTCQCIAEPNSPSVPVAYDLRIVDSDVGEEYSIKGVHCRNGESISLLCQSVIFETKETFRGQRAHMISQTILGRKMEGDRPVVYNGTITMEVNPTKKDRPWVL